MGAWIIRTTGKLEFLPDISVWHSRLLQQGVKEIPVDGLISIESTRLKDFNRDPGDRIIIATALRGYELITADQEILNWNGRLKITDARI